MNDINMEQIVIKTEVQPNGDILLFYVDDNQEEMDTDILNNEHDIDMTPETKYIIEDNGEGDSADELDIEQACEHVEKEEWLDEEITKLVIFYIDNKETFLNGTTKKKHLWAVACRTMLTGKNSISCEAKLRSLKKKYAQICVEIQRGVNVSWSFYDVCHHAFNGDSYVQSCLNDIKQNNVVYDVPLTNVVNEDGVIVVKKINNSLVDENVKTMLTTYIKHKNSFPKRNINKSIWEVVALEIGFEDADYWHKRFLNFKQHYIRNLYKRQESGPGSINWPYMKYFEQIYGDDEEFQQKVFPNTESISNDKRNVLQSGNVWTLTETTFLIKYYFDCFKEFQDPSIPDKFLWHEVGRLLAKNLDNCRNKFLELKNEHFNTLIAEEYDLQSRTPIAILFDNIISQETEIVLRRPLKDSSLNEKWKTEQIDDLVQYLYENMDMLKDQVCYYVCWAAVAKKLNTSMQSCRKQWNYLTELYKSILEDKKENSDMQIDWRYINVFDIIFDYGMDTRLLNGYEKLRECHENNYGNIGDKKNIFSDEKYPENASDEEETYDERGFMKRTKKRNGDQKAFKILEYYLKNKDKFASSQYKKLSLWETLAKQIGISASQCAHRFRNFKQVYTAYVQREINKPEMPILWPYYSLCKKVFGYRAIKSKLKNGKMDSDDAEDWSAKEIKQLINYFGTHYYNMTDNIEERSKWTDLAKELGRTESSCCEKFLELRKSYRKLKTIKSRNPDANISWKYFNMIDHIYNNKVDNNDTAVEKYEIDEDSIIIEKVVGNEDEDYQCIIVVPEGEDIFYDTKVIEHNNECLGETKQPMRMFKWNKRSKIRLLKLYLQYLKTHKYDNISFKDMWASISKELDDKTPGACRKMYFKLKNDHKEMEDNYKTPYKNVLSKIMSLKRHLKVKSNSQEGKAYEDVEMSEEKVIKALQFYLENIDNFNSMKFEKKFLWDELAKYVAEPAIDVFNKINFLRQNFDNDKEIPYKDILKEIHAKENRLRDGADTDKTLEEDGETVWSDVETERLLTWYLAHLDKFKNPKFVRSYLWMEASDILKKNPLVCSKKMTEIRSQYRTMMKENPDGLEEWRFYNLCQRIYGTGKKTA